MAEKFTRGELFRRFIKPAVKQMEPQEPDYISMLPPEFTDTMLAAEVSRLGEDPGKLTKNQMAGIVLGAMSSQTRQS